MTEIELKAMAAPAMTGFSKIPVIGYKTPAHLEFGQTPVPKVART